jgi:hypothetical protein
LIHKAIPERKEPFLVRIDHIKVTTRLEDQADAIRLGMLVQIGLDEDNPL